MVAGMLTGTMQWWWGEGPCLPLKLRNTLDTLAAQASRWERQHAALETIGLFWSTPPLTNHQLVGIKTLVPLLFLSLFHLALSPTQFSLLLPQSLFWGTYHFRFTALFPRTCRAAVA